MTPNNNHQQTPMSNASTKTLDIDDSWVKKIWAWADEFELLDS
ncbi:MAG: hypothetical protein WA114_01675 [Psychrobacter glacincola]